MGSGPEGAQLMAQMTKDKITNVTFAGHCKPADVVSALRHSRLYLLTSQEEGTPTTVIEAMAIGLPIVITPSNNYDWLIAPGVNGFVTSSWDVPEICAKMDKILGEEEKRQIISRNNVTVANQQRWSIKAETVTSLMREVLYDTKN